MNRQQNFSTSSSTVVQSNPRLKTLLTPKLSKYIPHSPTVKQQAFLWLNQFDAFFGGAAGGGKILANDGIVLTPFGWKKGSSLCVGDLLNNPDGSVQRIIQIKPEVSIPKWTVHFNDKTFTDVAGDHLWLAWKGGKGRKINGMRSFGKDSAEVVETKEIQEWIERGYTPQIPLCSPQKFNITINEKNKLCPYLLGVLLGDGYLPDRNLNLSIACSEDDKDHYKDIFGFEDMSYVSPCTVRFVGNKNKYIKKKLKSYGLLGKTSETKFIPQQYLYSSIDDRVQIIQGLMDTDGWTGKNKKAIYYDTVSPDLAEGMAFMLRSLGCMVTITNKQGKYKNDKGEFILCKQVYSLYIKAPDPDLFFKMERKKTGNFGRKEISKSISHIERKGIITGRCITVSNPNGLYITNDFIVTHNSDALLMAALQYVEVPGYSALLVRDTFKNLSMEGSLIQRSMEWLSGTDVKWKEDKKKYEFPSGAVISFGYLDSPRDHFNYQSSEFQFIGIDEMVNIRQNQADYLFSRIRRKIPEAYREDLRRLPKYKSLTDKEIDLYYRMYENIPLRYRGASNPPTREQLARGTWVKNKYIDSKKRQPDVIYIPAKLEDNPHVDTEEYERSLNKLDEITREQLRHGNWDIQIEGNIFDRKRLFYYDVENFSISDIRKGRTICILDPAKGNDSEQADFPAIIWMTVTPDEKVRIIDNIDDKIPLEDALREAACRNIRYGVREFVYESNATLLLENVIRDIHKEEALKMGIKEYNISIRSEHHSGNKVTRIINMQPRLYSGIVEFRNDYEVKYPELFAQLANFGSWPHDDFPDVIEFGLWYLQDQGFEFIAIGANGIITIDNKQSKSFSMAISPIEIPDMIQANEWGLFSGGE